MLIVNFIAKSKASKEALKSATILKNLSLNALIVGQDGVGKKTLAKIIIQAPIIDGENFDDLLCAIFENDSIIIKNFHKIRDYSILKERLGLKPTRIIATSKEEINKKIEDDFFSLKISIPPLCERSEDIKPLYEKFYDEAKAVLFNDEKPNISFETLNINLDFNAHSLRKSIFLAVLGNSLHEEDLFYILEKFLSKRLGSGSDYKNLLYLFDVPLIKAGLKKETTLLATSKALGINRNTLRKKIDSLNKYLK